MKIDLNADLGEGCASDAELLTLVSSANIACGFHAGDAQTMQACVREAIKNGVAIGAHPSFPDRENFGRRAMQLPPETVYAQRMRFGSRIYHFVTVGDLCLHARHRQNLIFKLKKQAPPSACFFYFHLRKRNQ